MIAVDDPDFTLHVGDALEVLATMPDESVHCVVTSPPYWGLRDYGTGSWDGGDDGCDHAHKNARNDSDRLDAGLGGGHGGGTTVNTTIQFRDVCGKCGARRADHQLGLEPTPEEYVSSMVAVFREVRRVLRRDGTCWLNIGDSYASNGQRGDTRAGFNERYFGSGAPGKQAATAGEVPPNVVPAGLKPKDLVGIPWRLAFALQTDGWYLRSDIIWSKPNPMPESVTDRPTKAHEYLFLLTKSARYFYDADAIREPHSPDGRLKTVHDHGTPNSHENYDNVGNGNERWPNGGRNRRSVWEIATEPYPDAHFATFPQALVEPCVLAGTSERGCCPVCGAPWERETETTYTPGGSGGARTKRPDYTLGGKGITEQRLTRHDTTTGWRPTCECGGVDLTPVLSPLGERVGEDPSLVTGRAGMNRPRGDAEGRRPITRYEQQAYAAALKASPACAQMEADAGEAFAHYIRTDRSGARPIPADLLGRWIDKGWLERVAIPDHEPPEPVPATIFDPFMGSGTVAVVARRLGRRAVGVELNPGYVALCVERTRQLSLLA